MKTIFVTNEQFSTILQISGDAFREICPTNEIEVLIRIDENTFRLVETKKDRLPRSDFFNRTVPETKITLQKAKEKIKNHDGALFFYGHNHAQICSYNKRYSNIVNIIQDLGLDCQQQNITYQKTATNICKMSGDHAYRQYCGDMNIQTFAQQVKKNIPSHEDTLFLLGIKAKFSLSELLYLHCFHTKKTKTALKKIKYRTFGNIEVSEKDTYHSEDMFVRSLLLSGLCQKKSPNDKNIEISPLGLSLLQSFHLDQPGPLPDMLKQLQSMDTLEEEIAIRMANQFSQWMEEGRGVPPHSPVEIQL